MGRGHSELPVRSQGCFWATSADSGAHDTDFTPRPPKPEILHVPSDPFYKSSRGHLHQARLRCFRNDLEPSPAHGSREPGDGSETCISASRSPRQDEHYAEL